MGPHPSVAVSFEIEPSLRATPGADRPPKRGWEVPRAVVVALLDGDDPLVAALDAGVHFVDAVSLEESLGLR